jgi:hypothetical protein
MNNANDRRDVLRDRLGRSISRLAGGAIRGSDAPTQIISVVTVEDLIPQRHARLVIDFCLRAGEAMLATGASAADVVATVLRISTAYGISGMHVDITFTSLTISIHRGMNEDPMSVMRIVKVRTTDYSRLQDVYLLIDEITSPGDQLGVEEARERLTSILTNPHPYRRWVVTAGKGDVRRELCARPGGRRHRDDLGPHHPPARKAAGARLLHPDCRRHGDNEHRGLHLLVAINGH